VANLALPTILSNIAKLLFKTAYSKHSHEQFSNSDIAILSVYLNPTPSPLYFHQPKKVFIWSTIFDDFAAMWQIDGTQLSTVRRFLFTTNITPSSLPVRPAAKKELCLVSESKKSVTTYNSCSSNYAPTILAPSFYAQHQTQFDAAISKHISNFETETGYNLLFLQQPEDINTIIASILSVGHQLRLLSIEKELENLHQNSSVSELVSIDNIVEELQKQDIQKALSATFFHPALQLILEHKELKKEAWQDLLIRDDRQLVILQRPKGNHAKNFPPKEKMDSKTFYLVINSDGNYITLLDMDNDNVVTESAKDITELAIFLQTCRLIPKETETTNSQQILQFDTTSAHNYALALLKNAYPSNFNQFFNYAGMLEASPFQTCLAQKMYLEFFKINQFCQPYTTLKLLLESIIQEENSKIPDLIEIYKARVDALYNQTSSNDVRQTLDTFKKITNSLLAALKDSHEPNAVINQCRQTIQALYEKTFASTLNRFICILQAHANKMLFKAIKLNDPLAIYKILDKYITFARLFGAISNFHYDTTRKFPLELCKIFCLEKKVRDENLMQLQAYSGYSSFSKEKYQSVLDDDTEVLCYQSREVIKEQELAGSSDECFLVHLFNFFAEISQKNIIGTSGILFAAYFYALISSAYRYRALVGDTAPSKKLETLVQTQINVQQTFIKGIKTVDNPPFPQLLQELLIILLRSAFIKNAAEMANKKKDVFLQYFSHGLLTSYLNTDRNTSTRSNWKSVIHEISYLSLWKPETTNRIYNEVTRITEDQDQLSSQTNSTKSLSQSSSSNTL
jgi:hypothetical protein